MCYEVCNDGIWLQNFITKQNILEGVERPLKIYCDNKLVVIYSKSNRSLTKAIHIDIKFLRSFMSTLLACGLFCMRMSCFNRSLYYFMLIQTWIIIMIINYAPFNMSYYVKILISLK